MDGCLHNFEEFCSTGEVVLNRTSDLSGNGPHRKLSWDLEEILSQCGL